MDVNGCSHVDEAYEDGYEEGLAAACDGCSGSVVSNMCGVCGIWDVDTQSCYYYPHCSRFESCEHWVQYVPDTTEYSHAYGWVFKKW